MKKIDNRRIILIISLIMIFCLILGACSSGGIAKQNAYQLIKEAVEKTSKLESYEIYQNVITSTELLGEKMDTVITFNINVADATGNAPKAAGTMNMSLMGEEIKLDVYYENDVIYLSSEEDGIKVKINASEAEAATYQFSDTQENLIKSLPEDVLKDVKVKDNDDKSRTVELELDDAKFSEIYNELISQLSNEEAYAGLIDDLKVTTSVKDANVKITVLPSGYLGQYDIRFDMDIKMVSASSNLDYTTTMGIDASVIFKDPGTKKTVTAPSDLDQYTDYSVLTAE